MEVLYKDVIIYMMGFLSDKDKFRFSATRKKYRKYLRFFKEFTDQINYDKYLKLYFYSFLKNEKHYKIAAINECMEDYDNISKDDDFCDYLEEIGALPDRKKDIKSNNWITNKFPNIHFNAAKMSYVPLCNKKRVSIYCNDYPRTTVLKLENGATIVRNTGNCIIKSHIKLENCDKVVIWGHHIVRASNITFNIKDVRRIVIKNARLLRMINGNHDHKSYIDEIQMNPESDGSFNYGNADEIAHLGCFPFTKKLIIYYKDEGAKDLNFLSRYVRIFERNLKKYRKSLKSRGYFSEGEKMLIKFKTKFDAIDIIMEKKHFCFQNSKGVMVTQKNLDI